MRFPLSMTAAMAKYIFRNRLRPRPEWQRTVQPPQDTANPFRILPAKTTSAAERKPHPMLHRRFPIVLMLEPLHACNLTCTGCGRIREYESTMTERVPLEECLTAVGDRDRRTFCTACFSGQYLTGGLAQGVACASGTLPTGGPAPEVRATAS